MTNKKPFLPFIFLVISCLFFSSLWASDIKNETFAKRRQKLMQTMGEGIGVFQNADMATRSNDTKYHPFRTDADFYYLTGFEEPEAAFILLPEGDKKFIMFVKAKNAMSSQWFGDVPGVEGAMKAFGADTAFAIDEFEKKLRQYLFRKKRVYYNIKNEDLHEKIHSITSGLFGRGPKEFVDVNQHIHEMRIIKNAEEIEIIRHAVNISCEAHLEVMKAMEPGMFEYEIGSIFDYTFHKSDCQHAYEAIVASGPNSTIFHYSKLKRKTQDGDLVMMDVGAEYKNYASDITRILPVNGKFTKEQKEIYEIAFAMEEVIIDLLKPGNKVYDGLKLAENIAKEGLYELGLITDKESKWQHYLYYFPYAMHAVGLDVHDVGNYGNFRTGGDELKPGMIFAVEPLIYIGDNLIDAFRMGVNRRFSIPLEEIDAFLEKIKPTFEKYKEIACRVEDNILITEDGNENLSSHLPKTIEEIEKIMAEKSYLNKN